MNTEENNIANNSAGVQRIVQMERTIDDLFGPSFSAASKSSFMKPPTTMKKHPINHEKESLDKPCEALKPQNTENVKPQVPFIMKPPSKKEPSLGQEKPPSTTSAFEASSNKPVFNFEKPSIAPIKPAPLPESTSISPLKPTATTLKPNSNTAPAFVVKASPFMSFKYQISLQDWFFVSMEGSLCAIGKRIDIEETWKSEEVMIRVEPRTFITTSQVQYQLIGPAKPPFELQSQHQPFSEGLPALWKQLIK